MIMPVFARTTVRGLAQESEDSRKSVRTVSYDNSIHWTPGMRPRGRVLGMEETHVVPMLGGNQGAWESEAQGFKDHLLAPSYRGRHPREGSPCVSRSEPGVSVYRPGWTMGVNSEQSSAPTNLGRCDLCH